MFTQEFTPVASLRYHPQEIVAINTMLNRLVDTPDKWFEHLKMYVCSYLLAYPANAISPALGRQARLSCPSLME